MKALPKLAILLPLSVCMAAFGLVACSPRQSSTPGSAAAPTAVQTAPVKVTLVYLEGRVTIDGAPAQIGQSLGTTVKVETGAASSCQIEFGGKNIMNVSQNAVAAFDFSKVVVNVQLKQGGLTSVLKGLAVLPNQDSFVVTSGAAVAGVRGTSFCMWCDESSTYVCACNGTVRTIDPKGSNEQLLTAAHHVARVYSSRAGAISVVPAGILHHSDESVQSIAAKIGYTVDWTRAD